MTPQTLDEHRLRRLLEVRSLVSELDLEALLHRVLDVARELTGARYAALGVLDEQGEELERFITTGIDEETRRTIGDLPRGRGILGELIRHPEPLRLRDLSEHPRSYGFPPGHPPMHGFLGVRVLIRGEVYGNLYLTEKDGGEFDADDEHSLVVLAEWAAIAIANARLYSGVEKQRNELQRAVDGLEATSAIAKAVGGETEIDPVLELIVKRGRALVEARTLVILLTEGDHLRVAATAGEADGHPDLQIPIADSLLGDIVRSGKAERLADVKSRVRLGLGELSSDAESALLVPLTFRGHTSGVLIAFDRSAHGPAFDAEDERLLSSFAASAATAVATAQTVEADRLQHSIEAAEQERRRWARELHDETLQGLGALQVLLSTARRRGDHLDEAIAQASTQIEAEIEKLQALITELRPAALDEIGVGPAIESLVERARTLHGLEIESDIDLDYDAGRQATRLTPEIESAIYRLVQESLTNVGKHAGADKALLRVVEAEGQITVEVRDDGRGFDPEQPNGGFGLVGMRERAGLLGGTLEVASEPGEGSTVRARLAAEHVAAGGQEGPAATSGSGAA